MDKADYVVRGYTPAHRTAVVGILGLFWSLSADQAEQFFKWKYENCPFTDAPLITLLLHNDVVVGMRGAGAIPVFVNDVEQVAALVGDSWIDPAHRSARQFDKVSVELLDQLRAAGITLIMNTSATDKVYRHSLRTGWKELDVTNRWVIHPGEARQVEKVFEAFDCQLNSILPLENGKAMVTDTVYPELMESLVDRVGGLPDGIALNRSDAFLRWRFVRPDSSYRFIYLFDDQVGESGTTPELKGYLAIAPEGGMGVMGYIVVDWLYVNNRDLVDSVILLETLLPGCLLSIPVSDGLPDLENTAETKRIHPVSNEQHVFKTLYFPEPEAADVKTGAFNYRALMLDKI